MIVFVENGLGLWDLFQHQIMSLIQDFCPVLLNMSWIVWEEERTDLIFSSSAVQLDPMQISQSLISVLFEIIQVQARQDCLRCFFISFVWELFKRMFKMFITNVFSVYDWFITSSRLISQMCHCFYSTQSVAELAFSECGHGWEDSEITSRAWNWIKSTWNIYTEEINGKWC